MSSVLDPGQSFLFWLCWVFIATRAFLWLQRAEATLHCDAQVSHAVASLVVEHRPWGPWASAVVARGL